MTIIAPLHLVPTPLAAAASAEHAVKVYGTGLTEARLNVLRAIVTE